MDIAANGDGCADGLYVRFLDQQLADDVAQLLEIIFRQVLALLHNFDPLVQVRSHGSAGTLLAGSGGGRFVVAL